MTAIHEPRVNYHQLKVIAEIVIALGGALLCYGCLLVTK